MLLKYLAPTASKRSSSLLQLRSVQSVFSSQAFAPITVGLQNDSKFSAIQSRHRSSTSASRLAALGKHGSSRLTPNFFTMTKVVATVGPASDEEECIAQFVKDGMRIMRINFSHAKHDEAKRRMVALINAEGSHKSGYYLDKNGNTHHVKNCRAILLDTRGPEIRTGVIPQKVELKKGNEVILQSEDEKPCEGKIYVDYKEIHMAVSTGDTILLDDGGIGLRVKEVKGREVICVIQNTGLLGSRKGVNLPGKVINLPGVTEQDEKDLRFGIENDIDFVAQSFVRRASDVVTCRRYIEKVMAELKIDTSPPRIIAKIESAEALENFDAILEAADGIMVARGDLGVEIPFEKVTQAQKYMIKRCNEVGKPVIVATQMLESMQNSPRPTRAEVSDVINAIYDGADAVMLSGESANGKYPVESVQTMRRIVDEADDYISSQHEAEPIHIVDNAPISRQEAVCRAAASAAEAAGAKLIIVLCRGGTTARLLAKQRPALPIMAFCLHPKTARQLNIHRGVYPVVGKGVIGEPSPHRKHTHTHKNADEAINTAKDCGWVQKGDIVVIVQASPRTATHSSTLGMSAVVVD